MERTEVKVGNVEGYSLFGWSISRGMTQRVSHGDGLESIPGTSVVTSKTTNFLEGLTEGRRIKQGRKCGRSSNNNKQTRRKSLPS